VTEYDEETIILPLKPSGTYDFKVYWGDGTSSSIDNHIASNVYATAGTHIITITGVINGFGFNGDGHKDKILDVQQWGGVELGNNGGYFQGCTNLGFLTATDSPDLASVTDMSRMFSFAKKFNSDLNTWNTAGITDIGGLFYGASVFNGDISHWNTASVTKMVVVFRSAVAFNGDVSAWNTADVTTMGGMFRSASAFTSDLSAWNTAKVTNLNTMFDHASVFTSDLSSWNTAKVTAMNRMLYRANTFTSDLSAWNTAKVTNMHAMFHEITFNGDLSAWNTASVTNMDRMFAGDKTINSDLSSWNTASVIQMSYMFSVASAFTSDLSAWNTASVTTMFRMFYSADAFNSDVGAWNTASVTTMVSMFTGVATFNGDLRGWDVGRVALCDPFCETCGLPAFTECSTAFVTAWRTTGAGETIILPLTSSGVFNFAVNWGDGSSDARVTTYNDPRVTHSYSTAGTYTVTITGSINGFGFNNLGDKTKIVDVQQWGSVGLGNGGGYFYGCNQLTMTATDSPDLSSVVTLANMFRSADVFNGDVIAWNTASVETMYWMFRSAEAFNGDLSAWNTAGVTQMYQMFSSATAFNCDLNAWNTASVANMDRMFANAVAFNSKVSGWDTARVTNMLGMFRSAVIFNGDLSAWNTAGVTFMYWMFYSAVAFNGDVSAWDTASVTRVDDMFHSTSIFNGDLSAWNTACVTDMSGMFNGASSFNCDLGFWNTAGVSSMRYMFWEASSYAKDLRSWNTAKVGDCEEFCATENNESLTCSDIHICFTNDPDGKCPQQCPSTLAPTVYFDTNSPSPSTPAPTTDILDCGDSVCTVPGSYCKTWLYVPVLLSCVRACVCLSPRDSVCVPVGLPRHRRTLRVSDYPVPLYFYSNFDYHICAHYTVSYRHSYSPSYFRTNPRADCCTNFESYNCIHDGLENHLCVRSHRPPSDIHWNIRFYRRVGR
jgi:surface protein